MQNQGRQQVEVVIDGGKRFPNGSVEAQMRPLTAYEALQFSPLTTSTTVGYGILAGIGYLFPQLTKRQSAFPCQMWVFPIYRPVCFSKMSGDQWRRSCSKMPAEHPQELRVGG